MDRIYIHFFGTPMIYLNENRTSFPFKKAEALFYYLVIKKRALKDELSALFWPDVESEKARKNLRNSIYNIRNVLGKDVLLSPQKDFVALNPNMEIQADIQIFTLTNNEEALHLYKGEFLEGFSIKDSDLFDSWIFEQRDYFNELYKSKLDNIITSSINKKNYKDAKQYLKQYISIDEFNEEAYRTLMKVYEAEGLINDALGLYGKLKYRLETELSVKPDAETAMLYKKLLEAKNHRPEYLRTNGKSFFYGRRRELSFMQNLFASFLNGTNAQSFMLVGEAGVGKTALLQHFLNKIDIEGMILLRTDCNANEEKYSLRAWTPILTKIIKVYEGKNIKIPEAWVNIIASLFPGVLENVENYRSEALLNPNTIAYGIVEEVMSGILSIWSRDNKLLIIIEDIQWIDSLSLNIISKIISVDKNKKILFIMTSRNEYSKRTSYFVSELSRHHLITKLEIQRFTRNEVAEFSAATLPQGMADKELTDKIYAETEGNAFFITECLNLLKSGEGLTALSRGMEAILSTRISYLSDEAQKILNILSVFFSHINFDLILSLSDKNEMELSDIMEELQNKFIIEEISSEHSGYPCYRFTHAKIREFVYSKLSSSKKSIMHNKAGLIIETGLKNEFTDSSIYPLLIYHFINGGNKAKTLYYRVKLIYTYFPLKNELFPTLNDIYLGINDCYMTQQEMDNHLKEINALIEAIRIEGGNLENQYETNMMVMHIKGQYCIWQGDYRNGTGYINKMIQLSYKIHNVEYAVKGYHQMVYYGIQINNAKTVAFYSNKILDAAKEHNIEELIGIAYRFLGVYNSMILNFEEAKSFFRRSISLFKKLELSGKHYTLSIAACFNYIGEINRREKNYTKAIECFEQAIKLCEQKNIFIGLQVFYTNAGRAAFDMEYYSKAKAYLVKALDYCKHCNFLGSQSIANGIMCMVYINEGKYDAALDSFVKANEYAGRYKNDDIYKLLNDIKSRIKDMMLSDVRLKNVFLSYIPPDKPS